MVNKKPLSLFFIFLLVCFSVGLLTSCIQVSSGAPVPTAMPVAIVPTVPTATLPPAPATATPPPTAVPSPTSLPATNTPLPTITAVPSPSPSPTNTLGYTTSVIGYSAAGRPLTDYQFGDGPAHLVFIGGIHGGYEWNTILLAYDMIDYLTANPDLIPAEATVHIIPALNPDGQFLVTGQEGRFWPLDVAANSLPGRVNGNGVDLNRNWDCFWTANALWRDQPTNGGTQPFSEPETLALSNFLLDLNPAAVVFWHSAANGVFAAGCPDLYQPSANLATIYGRAAGYPVYETFTSYQVTGDAGDWLSLQGIPAVSVELLNHEDLDWAKNVAGVTAVFRQFEQISK
jgi:predicted deacylase